MLQILDSMIDYLDLLLHYRHPAGKVVMLPHLVLQLLQAVINQLIAGQAAIKESK